MLVDTYDTLKSGIPNAIRVFQEMKDAGVKLHNYGIRMDSGDLAYLSKKVRQMLDAAGFPDAIISASNDLDEYLIETLKIQGAKITSWGVGTSLITSRDCPAFGGVYKLAAIRNEDGHFTPKIKLCIRDSSTSSPRYTAVMALLVVVLPIPISPVASISYPCAWSSSAFAIPTSMAATAWSLVMACSFAIFFVP